MLHLLNWGMGVESTAILAQWIFNPETRPFTNFDELIVLVAQTGDEYRESKELCEAHILPLMREYNVRLVQVARAGHSEKDGYIVLDDSRQPQQLFTDGAHKLSTELITSGTVPRLGRPHFCAMKFKGYALDAWIRDNITEAFGPYIGYNSDEAKRMTHANEYGCRGELYRYPLIDEGKNRQWCIDYLQEKFGVLWAKSCCQFCPFQQKTAVVERWMQDPEAGGFAAFIERVALSFNPRMNLFGDVSAYDLLITSGNVKAIAHFNAQLESCEWAVYKVQRIYRQFKTASGRMQVNADRNIKNVFTGRQNEAIAKLQEMARVLDCPVITDGPMRFYEIERQPLVYPTLEFYYVVAPALSPDKCRNIKTFQAKWQEVLSPQLNLFELS